MNESSPPADGAAPNAAPPLPVDATPPAPAAAKLFGLNPWAVALPVMAIGAVLIGKPDNGVLAALLALLLGGAIMAAVYHAEVLAHYLGEPFGTLTLALAVTEANREARALYDALGFHRIGSYAYWTR